MQIRSIEFEDSSKSINSATTELPCFYLARPISYYNEIEVIIFCCSRDNNVVYWPSGAIGLFDDKDIKERFKIIRQIPSGNMQITFKY